MICACIEHWMVRTLFELSDWTLEMKLMGGYLKALDEFSLLVK